MLKIFLKKCKKKINKISKKLKQNNINNIYKIRTKEFLPANKEWFTSVYAYNKNYLKNLPSYDKTVTKLIKSFFFLHPLKTRSFKLLKRYKKKKRLSINRIWLSKAEIKHTNSKAIFTYYIYNAEKRYLVRKLRKINPLQKKGLTKKINKINNKKKRLIKLIKRITGKKRVISKYKKKYWFWYKNKKLNREKEKKNKFKSKLKKPRWLSRLLRKFLKKTLRKQKLSIYYKYLVWFNKSKFKNTYLSFLSKLIRNFYEKKIEFNFINLKYLHLNSSIFSQFIVYKLKKRQIRLRKYLKRLFKKLPISEINKYKVRSRRKALLITIESQKYKDLYPFYLLKKTSLASQKKTSLASLALASEICTEARLALLRRGKRLQYNKKNIIKKDLLNQLIEKTLLMENEQKKILKIEKKDKNYLEKIILDNIKYKTVSGLRLDLAGRISRRFIASRSIYIKKYKGNLKNIESSYRGSSSSMIRGQLKSNIEYTKITSFVRIGSFGVKGWISTI